jgi:hypothetical protein
MSMDNTKDQTSEEQVDTATDTTEEQGAEEQESQDEGGGSSDSETTKEPLQTDYKVKYEDLQKKIATDAFRFRKEKRQDDTESADEADDDKPLTRAEMQKMLDDREQKILRQSSTKEAITLARSFTDNDDEAKYAATLWEHVTLPFDSMEEQMRFIIGGMNAERLLAKNSELLRTVQSKTMARKNTATTARDATGGTAPKIDGQVKQALERTGFKYETTKKAWVKTLANGKKMYNDGHGKKWFE